MIDREGAIRLVESVLREEERKRADLGRPLPMGIVAVDEHRLGWLVYWQSQTYIQSRKNRDFLVGTGPYLVDRHDGSVHFIPGVHVISGVWEEEYEERVRPSAAERQDALHGVPFSSELREVWEREGRIAAVRRLRRLAPGLTITQADAYIAAIAAATPPSAALIELVEVHEPPRPWEGPTTFAVPVAPSIDS